MDQEFLVADQRVVQRMDRVGCNRLQLGKEDLACASWVALLADSWCAALYRAKRWLQLRENSKTSVASEADLVYIKTLAS